MEEISSDIHSLLQKESIWVRPDLLQEFERLKERALALGYQIVCNMTREEVETALGRKLPGGKLLGAYCYDVDTVFLFPPFGLHPLVLYKEVYHGEQLRRYPPEILNLPCSEKEMEAFGISLELEGAESTLKYSKGRNLNSPEYERELKSFIDKYWRRLLNLNLTQDELENVIKVFCSPSKVEL